jgi:predicted amidophosphoribosyltransferase
VDWVELLWPAVCLGCSAFGRGRVCASCVPPGLHRAGLRVEGVAGVWALSGYDAPLGVTVAIAKARADRALLDQIANAAAVRAARCVSSRSFSAVVPAPSSHASLLRRGWSGASLFAGAVSRQTGIPMREVAARHGGRRQATLGRAARAKNLQGRVRVETPMSGRVLLVDDVITTGTTAAACARELLGAGASEVWVLALCVVRQPQPAEVAPLPALPRVGSGLIQGPQTQG